MGTPKLFTIVLGLMWQPSKSIMVSTRILAMVLSTANKSTLFHPELFRDHLCRNTLLLVSVSWLFLINFLSITVKKLWIISVLIKKRILGYSLQIVYEYYEKIQASYRSLWKRRKILIILLIILKKIYLLG